MSTKTNTHRLELTRDDQRIDFRDYSPLQPLSAKLTAGFALLTIATSAGTYFILHSQLHFLTPFSKFCCAIGFAAFVCSTSLIVRSLRHSKAARRLLPASAANFPENWLDYSDDDTLIDWARPIIACRDCDQRLTITEFPGVVARIRQQWADHAVDQFNKHLLAALLPAVAGFMAGSGQLAFIEIGSVFGSWLHFFWPLVGGTGLALLGTLLALLACSGWERAFEDWQRIANACLTHFAAGTQPQMAQPVITPTPGLNSPPVNPSVATPSAAPLGVVQAPNPSPQGATMATETTPLTPPAATIPPFMQASQSPWGKPSKVIPEVYIPENTDGVEQEP
jgi:hypothetical protein